MKIIKDEFNSEIFCMKMGNICELSNNILLEEVHQKLLKAKEESYQHLSVKVPTDMKKTTNIFLESGFYLVDTQLMYRLNTKTFREYSNKLISYRQYQDNDKKTIVAIAKNAYKLDQYHSDTALNNDLCDMYYAKWIQNCCNGLADKVMVATDNNDLVEGYITFDFIDNKAVVGLAAVDKRYRGHGVFTYLIGSTLKMLRDLNIDYLYYGTQLNNKPVLRTMGHFCGAVEYSNYVMHLKL